MGRHANGGRNWEGFGPDPYLAGVAMNASVSGIQSAGVQACSKHYIANEQETQRTLTNVDGVEIDAVSSNLDDRTLHELYLWPFANAVRAGTASIMCSYNRVNGEYSCANEELMSILKDELAFPGYVVSDWYATHETLGTANAGLDLEMPGPVSELGGQSYFGDGLLAAVIDGLVTEDRLREMAENVMRPYFYLGQDEDFPSVDPSSAVVFAIYQYGHNFDLPIPYDLELIPARDVRGDHADRIRELGAAGTVLLKNVNNTLPLKNKTHIGVFGNGAPYPIAGSAFIGEPERFEMGTLDIGGGSGTVRHTNLVAPLDAIQQHVRSLGGRVQVLLSNDEIARGDFNTIYPVPEACLLFLKAFASEGSDMPSIELQSNATVAVESTASMCPNTIVIVHGPGVVAMPWTDNENVTAILHAHYPGEETGNSLVDVLWGAKEPSGRLPYSIPRKQSDYGPPIVNLTQTASGRDDWQADFNEGQLIDYKHFDANNISALYEFGFGLGYTDFEMGGSLDIEVGSGLSARADASKGIAPGGLEDLWTPIATVTVEVTNTGSRSGSTVPQLYVSFPQDTTPEGTPVKVLRGFEKVILEAGETRQVEFKLLRRDLSFWDQGCKRWLIPEGTFTFMAGFSSRKLMASSHMDILG